MIAGCVRGRVLTTPVPHYYTKERRDNPNHERIDKPASRLWFGLNGDCVQMSSVLRHVKKYRPNWTADYCAEEGKHQVGRGIVSNTFAYDDVTGQDKHYDAAVEICLYDTFAHWGDRPSTRVSSTLHERFGIDWDRECGRYQINVSDGAVKSARMLLSRGRRLVALHYKGDSSPTKKNLTDNQAAMICNHIEQLEYVPIILDWRRSCPLVDRWRLTSPQEWGRNAEMVCAVVSQCRAFVGIDSGPSKCASATDTPTLVTWIGHHPAEFYDPAPNTTHMVPKGYHGLYPVCNNRDVIRFFEDNYTVRQYDSDPVVQICRWLEETLTG